MTSNTCHSTMKTLRAIQDILACLNTPRSLAVWLLFKNDEHDQLVDLKIDPGQYIDAEKFRDDYLATELLSKATFLKLSTDPLQKGKEKFEEAEIQCRLINGRFSAIPYCRDALPEWFTFVDHSAKRFISKVCGDFDRFLNDSVSQGRFGPGASLNVTGGKVSLYEKMRSKPQSTSKLVVYCQHLLDPRWVAGSLEADGLCSAVDREFCDVVRGNKVTFVPKNSKTHRPIAIEPSLNSWLQLGIGGALRSRLARHGINLNDQSINQTKARCGSIGGDLSTIDLSSASDTVSEGVVRWLLPEYLVEFLDVARSQFYTLDGQSLRYQKWSSMGNGYTFELESLIFASLIYGVCEYKGLDFKECSVYGDDLICHTSMASLLLQVLEWYGFKVNPKKTFVTTSFRESCGEHYFGGKSCKPFYIKELLADDFSVVRLHNAVWRWCQQDPYFFDDRFSKVILKLRGTLNEKWSEAPPIFGDSALHPIRDITRMRNGFVHYRLRKFRSRKRRGTHYHPMVTVALQLIGTDSSSAGFYTARGRSSSMTSVTTPGDPFYVPWLNQAF